MVKQIISIPNIITGIGILCVFVYVAGYLSGNIHMALAALLAAGISDALDGFLARSLGQETFAGLVLDKARDILLFLAIAGNLLWFGTPSTIFFLKVMIAAEIVWIAIIFAAPASDPHADHLFNKIRQGAYILLVLLVALARG